MRTIKFRAWDKIAKEMDYQWILSIHFNGQIYSGNFNITDRYEVMQFTGLHDKNGKEIYEGDIIEDAEYGRLKVYYAEGVAAFRLESLDENYYFDFEECGDYEVIGNIYQNPELIKEVK